MPGRKIMRIFTLFITLCVCLSASTQDLGICKGKVQQATGENIVSAKIILLLKDSVIKSTLTDDVGEYHFDQLVPGIYAIRAEHSGFRKKEIKDISIESGKMTLVRKIILEPYSGGGENVIFLPEKK